MIQAIGLLILLIVLWIVIVLLIEKSLQKKPPIYVCYPHRIGKLPIDINCKNCIKGINNRRKDTNHD